MYPLELIHSVRLITDVCLEVTPGQNVLCIADREENMEVVTLIAAECKAKGAEVAVVLIEPRKSYFHEPPRSIARAMKEADVIIVMAPWPLMHTNARREASAANVIVAALGGGITKEYLAALDLTREDLLEVRTLTEKIAQRITAASSANLITQAGTNLTMSLEGRSGLALVPFGKRGAPPCVVPDYAEAACAPIEDSAEGVAVIDGTMIGAENFEGPVEEPFEIHFRKGRVVEIGAGKDARRLESLLNTLEEGARNLGELGVNSNHKVPKRLRGTRTDMRIGGHIHIALGYNDNLGGKTKVNSHLDFLVTNATLLLDGEPILENGSFKI